VIGLYYTQQLGDCEIKYQHEASWASAYRGKWGQLTPLEKWIKKLKNENMQKKAVFYVYAIF